MPPENAEHAERPERPEPAERREHEPVPPRRGWDEPKLGKADTQNVSGTDAQQPEIAQGPAEGLEPGERVARGSWQPPVAEDAPPSPGGAPDGEPFTDAEPAGTHDPGVSPEDEGIPNLQDGTPEQQWSSDPQQESVPGDLPTAGTRAAPTPAESREGESLDERLAQQEPEADPRAAAEPGAGRDIGTPGVPSETSGRLYEEAEAMPPRRQDIHAEETGSNGLSAEEEATRTLSEDEAEAPVAEDETTGPVGEGPRETPTRNP
ncbi:hypothetical protein [Streptomyces sp. NHF165]|nr:hypothetical protein [Streptomyces sp. NHF165]